MSSRQNNSSSVSVVFLMFLALILWYFSGAEPKQAETPDQNSDEVKIASDTPTGGADDTVKPEGIPATENSQNNAKNQDEDQLPSLIAVNKTADANELILVGENQDQGVVFSDQGSPEKVIDYLASVPGAVYAVTGNQNTDRGKLIKIDYKNNTTETIVDGLSTFFLPAINSSATSFAQVQFDNSETSFGFSLILKNLDGSSGKIIDRHPGGLSLPTWSGDSTKIAYLTGQPDPGLNQYINIHTVVDKKKTKKAVTKGLAVTDLAWLDSDTIAFIAEPIEKNGPQKSKIYTLEVTSGAIDELYDKAGKESHLVANTDGKFLAFRLETALEKSSMTTVILNTVNKTETKLESLGEVLAWIQ